ncbi:MAG: hypothetical protein NTV05_08725 [Acidobacteria bacterium]|nr:hypothetical protein [Acidobacteriota bacterium]
MVRHNLSTRPFYNERAVHAVLGLVSLAVIAATAFNVWEYSALSERHARLQLELRVAGQAAEALRARAATVRASINPRELDSTIAAADEANRLIDRRVFSWTELFNQFETALPETVHIASVHPRIEPDAGLVVSVVVVARSVEGIDTFVENLEKTGAFAGVLSRVEIVQDDGTLKATLEGQYTPGQARDAVTEAVRR